MIYIKNYVYFTDVKYLTLQKYQKIYNNRQTAEINLFLSLSFSIRISY